MPELGGSTIDYCHAHDDEVKEALEFGSAPSPFKRSKKEEKTEKTSKENLNMVVLPLQKAQKVNPTAHQTYHQKGKKTQILKEQTRLPWPPVLSQDQPQARKLDLLGRVASKTKKASASQSNMHSGAVMLLSSTRIYWNLFWNHDDD